MTVYKRFFYIFLLKTVHINKNFSNVFRFCDIKNSEVLKILDVENSS